MSISLVMSESAKPYRKCAAVMSVGPGTSTGVSVPEEGKLGVMGVAIPDAASDMKRTR